MELWGGWWNQIIASRWTISSSIQQKSVCVSCLLLNWSLMKLWGGVYRLFIAYTQQFNELWNWTKPTLWSYFNQVASFNMHCMKALRQGNYLQSSLCAGLYKLMFTRSFDPLEPVSGGSFYISKELLTLFSILWGHSRSNAYILSDEHVRYAMQAKLKTTL